ncbi:hypothetical protein LSAT2_005533 [Lamellibrachia satsuma]|nr:hypothetical protein LSAT2_005533 [Lamellibrachia satsuma]
MTGFSKTKGAFLISLLGITQTVSRVVFGWFAHLDIIDNRYIYQCTLLVCGATFCVMPFLQSYVLLATGSVLCSLSAGSFVVLSAVLVAESLGTANLPTTYGILYSTESLFFLASPVLMGWLRDVTGRWNDSFLVCGAMLIASASIYVLEPCAAKSGKINQPVFNVPIIPILK